MQTAARRFNKVFSVFLTGMPAVFAVLLSIYSILAAYKPQPLQQNLPNIGIFDIPSDAPIEDDLFLAGIEQAYEEIEAKKKAIEQPTTDYDPGGNYWEYPSIIYPCSRSGDDLLVLVNKSYQLPADYSPTDLTPIENSGIRATRSGMLIRTIIVTDLSALISAANTAGIDLSALSAYRSYDTQQSTYNYWVSYNNGNIAAADMVSARPGHSQHQLGTTIDFSTSEISDQLGEQFAQTAAGQWMAQHAWEYGFVLAYPQGAESITGYNFEPWHFRYIGRENAQEWQESGLTLEEWLEEMN